MQEGKLKPKERLLGEVGSPRPAPGSAPSALRARQSSKVSSWTRLCTGTPGVTLLGSTRSRTGICLHLFVLWVPVNERTRPPSQTPAHEPAPSSRSSRAHWCLLTPCGHRGICPGPVARARLLLRDVLASKRFPHHLPVGSSLQSHEARSDRRPTPTLQMSGSVLRSSPKSITNSLPAQVTCTRQL